MCVGRRARGWGWISTGRIAVTAGIRNFWQEYPKAITVDAAAGEMTAYLYSPWGPALDLRRYSDWLYPDHYESGAASDGIPEKFDHEREGARYIGKTSEIFLTFGEAGTPAGEVARDWLFFQDPPMLTAGAEQIARTRVFGRFTATDKEDPRAGANHYRQCIDFIVNEPDYRKWYSFINYGDVVHSFDPDRDAWRSDQGGYGWCNNESQMCEGLWTGFLATGDRRLFRLAEAMTRHISDVDMYQMGPATGRASRHNVSHWGCRNKERRKTIPEHKRIYYFLTGDEHTRDQVRLIYDAIVRDTEWIGGAMDFAVAATAMLFFWETTGRDAWGTRLKTACEAYCARRIKERGFVHQIDMDYATGKGTIPDSARSLEGFFLMDFGPMQILLAAAELTGSTIVHQAILDWAELLHLEPAQRAQYQTCFQVGRLGDTTSMRTAAYACEHTGDRRYMEYIRRGLEHPILAFETIGGNGPLEPAAHLVPRIYPETGKEWERLKEFQLGDSRVSFLWNLKGKYISGEVGHALWLARTLANFPYGWSVESM